MGGGVVLGVWVAQENGLPALTVGSGGLPLLGTVPKGLPQAGARSGPWWASGSLTTTSSPCPTLWHQPCSPSPSASLGSGLPKGTGAPK